MNKPNEDKWNAKWNELLQYWKANGDANVPFIIPRIGSWLSSQKKFYRAGVLSASREHKLRILNVELEESSSQSARVYEDKWNANWNELLQYWKANGDANPPYSVPRIGPWVNTQKLYYRKGKLSASRVHKLNILNVNVERKIHPEFEEWLELLKAYKEENGHANPKTNEKFRGKNLGFWISNFRHRSNNEAQIATLVELGVVMQPPIDSSNKDDWRFAQHKDK